MPQVRGTASPFHSVLADFLSENTDVLDHLVAEMYARRLSIRDIEKTIRTTNLIERSFGEERRRTKTLRRLFDKKSGLKIVFATLSRAAARWLQVSMSQEEPDSHPELRQERGIDPVPVRDTAKGGEKETCAA